MGALDSTHTIQIKQQNRGVAFLVGCVAIYLLLRWLVTGHLLSLAMLSWFKLSGDEEGLSSYGSVSAVAIPIIVDLVIGLGTIVIALGSGVWSIAWDLLSGVFQMVAQWRAKQAALNKATEVALDAAGVATGAAAGAAVAKQTATAVRKAKDGVDLGALKAFLQKIDERLSAMEKANAVVQEQPASVVQSNHAVLPSKQTQGV